jgi:gamma-glutamyltranspeptidase
MHSSQPPLVKPAVALAERGFAVPNMMAGTLTWRTRTPLRAGQILRQPEVGRFLRRLAEQGPDYVYKLDADGLETPAPLRDRLYAA